MKLISHSFADGFAIPAAYAFGKQAPQGHVALSDNRNPDFSWSGAPDGTQSFALICHDPDVPTRMDDVNQEGRVVSASLPRMTIYHWLLLDIPPTTSAIAEGSQASGVVPRGKPGPKAPHDLRHGLNDYTKWFADDADMRGDYYGYDGPCPPWNDEKLHHYVFTLYALDVPHLTIDGTPDGARVLDAMKGHVLATAEWRGTYTLNPAVRA